MPELNVADTPLTDADATAARVAGGGARTWAILGNSGSGKTTLARALAARTGAAVLDLDTVAWRPDCEAPTRRSVDDTLPELAAFVAAHPDGWVIEGCYEDLVAEALRRWRPVLVWLDVPAATCAARVRARAFEPHKYATPEAQAAAVEPLAAWIAAYETREGAMGRAAHAAVFEAHAGPKRRIGVDARAR